MVVNKTAVQLLKKNENEGTNNTVLTTVATKSFTHKNSAEAEYFL
jgi:hypothetical protein